MAKSIWRRAGWLVIVPLLIGACQAQPQAQVKAIVTATPDLATPAPAQPALTATATQESTRAPLWTFQTEGAVWSSPTVSEGVVYFGSDDHRLYAVDAGTGDEQWRFDTGGVVRSRPALADGIVYFASDDGYLYAVDAASGEQRWKVDIGNAVTPRGPLTGSYDYAQSSPAVAEGWVYIGSADGNLYVLDAATGEEKWRHKANAKIRSSPVVAGGLVYVGDKTDVLYALDALTGEEKWRFRGGGDQPTPTIVDGVVYVGGRSTYLNALDARTGEVKWRFALDGGSWVESSAAVVGDLVYVGSSDAVRLYALDKATGEKAWEYSTQIAWAWSSPAVADGVVYIGSGTTAGASAPQTCQMRGCFHAVDTATHAMKWQILTGESLDPSHLNGVVSSPAVADGVVYFGAMDGKLYAASTASTTP